MVKANRSENEEDDVGDVLTEPLPPMDSVKSLTFALVPGLV